MQRNGSCTSKSHREVKPRYDDDHENNHGVLDHEIANHDVRQSYQSGMEQEDDVGTRRHEMQVAEDSFPWTAPRVVLQYLEMRMSKEKPNGWSIDDCDGPESWTECAQRPEEKYRSDGDTRANQYHKMANAVYYWEAETDNLIEKWKDSEQENQQREEWRTRKDGAQQVCMEMHVEIEGATTPHTMRSRSDSAEEIVHASDDQAHLVDPKDRVTGNPLGTEAEQSVWKIHGQGHSAKAWAPEGVTSESNVFYNHEAGNIACFSGGQGKKRQKRVADSDDESTDGEEEQLACSMTGGKWEPLPYPIVIDSGACASVIPTDWCEHVNLMKTPQSESNEFFRAANGKKIFHEGQKLVTMMTTEGAMRDMNFI